MTQKVGVVIELYNESTAGTLMPEVDALVFESEELANKYVDYRRAEGSESTFKVVPRTIYTKKMGN